MLGRHKLTLWNVLLVAGTCLVLLGLYTTWWASDRAASRPQVAKGPLVPAAPLLRDQQPLTAFAVVSHKNLFSQSRTGPDLGQGKNHNVLEGRQLLGIIIIGDTRAALIEDKTQPQGKKSSAIEVVYQGDKWNGFKVADITNESVIFQGKDGRKTLTFPE